MYEATIEEMIMSDYKDITTMEEMFEEFGKENVLNYFKEISDN